MHVNEQAEKQNEVERGEEPFSRVREAARRQEEPGQGARGSTEMVELQRASSEDLGILKGVMAALAIEGFAVVVLLGLLVAVQALR